VTAIPDIVAKLKADGHRNKYIAFVLQDRAYMTVADIAEMLGVPRKTVANDMCRIREVIQGDNTRTEALWQGCDAAFVKYQNE